MKKITALIVLVLALVGIIWLSSSKDSPAFSQMSDVTVLIDAGHGGFDGGAVSDTGTIEADINLDIALRLESQLKSMGAAVIMTRTDNTALAGTKSDDMAARRKMIENSGADIVISIHQNKYSDPAVSGPQVFYYPGSTEGQRLAEIIQSELIRQLSPEKERVAMPENYMVVRSGDMPCVIVECGFISNPTEEALLKKSAYRIRIAQAIANGVSIYLFGSSEGEIAT